MFAYCENNPAMEKDESGHKSYCVDVADGAVFSPVGYEVYTYYYYDSCDLPDFDGKQFVYKPNKRGRVYIASGSSKPSQPSGFRNGDVLVWDNRDYINGKNGEEWQDPSMHIDNSYQYLNHSQHRAVAEVICSYTSRHPSAYEWKHTAETAVIEWEAHNSWYYWLGAFNAFGVFDKWIEKSRHADLDNDDVGKGFWGLAFE